MKVCKFEKIKDEDEMKQVINCIQKEHPYVAVVPILAQLQEWLQAISISWFHEEDEASLLSGYLLVTTLFKMICLFSKEKDIYESFLSF